MENKGIIVGSTIQFDYPSFDYNIVGTLTIKLQHFSKRADEITNVINKLSNIWHAIREGKTNTIIVIITLSNLAELEKIKSTINYFSDVISIEVSLWTSIRNIPENLSILRENKVENGNIEFFTYKNKVPKRKIKLNNKDRQIMESLAIDGRQPFSKIAKKVGMSVSATINRYKKLKMNNLIKVVIQVDPKKIGYVGHLKSNLTIASQEEGEKIVDQLSGIPNVNFISQTTGRFNIYLLAFIRNIDEYLSIQQKLEELPNLTAIETRLDRLLFNIYPTPHQQISTI